MGSGKSSNKSVGDLAILVVDDHRINREFLHAGLARRVSRIVAVENGERAIERCRGESFDVILMDLHMPGLDGLATAQRIRDMDEASSQAQIVALTADARPEERIRLLARGFDAYLNKPIGIADLLSAVEGLSDPDGRPTPLDRPRTPTRLIEPGDALAAVDGDAGLLGRLQAMLAGELEDRLPTFECQLLDGNKRAAAEQLHQWSGASGYAGAARLAAACRMLRARLLSGCDSSPGTACVHFLRTARATQQSLERN